MILPLCDSIFTAPVQLTWVFSGTVRENILFGKDFDAELYENVLSGCGLDEVRNTENEEIMPVQRCE